jgi:hypothetical protein
VYGAVPPLVDVLIVPSQALKQVTSVCEVIVTVGEPMLVTVMTKESEQPPPSVTTTVYVFAMMLERSCVTALLLHAYEYGVVPPLTVRSMLPFACPQVDDTVVAESASAVGCVTVTVCVVVQPFPSVTVQMNVPAQRFVAVCVVCAGVVFQL